MDRRTFLELTGLAGVAMATTHPGLARAQSAGDYDGPLYLYVHCGGGWDPTSFCDPKGADAEDSPNPMNHYLRRDIRRPLNADGEPEMSKIRWAPFGENDAFFEQHWYRTLIINGLDTSTNNHEAGTRYAASGELAKGHPCFAAMVAAVHGPNLPLAFVTNGGYDATRGVVGRVRVGSLNAIQRIAYPNQLGENERFHSDATQIKIRQFHATRRSRQLNAAGLPRVAKAMARFGGTRGNENELSRLVQFLPDLDAFSTGLGRQGAVALAGYTAGLTVSANLTTGGFDTHGAHDETHAAALTGLTTGLNEIWEEVERRGLTEKVTIVVGSDFGRTPGYNEGMGKDHWPVTSMMLMGAGVAGNRVIGGSDRGHRPMPVDPVTLEPAETGLTLTPAHVHRALRALAGVDGSLFEQTFGIETELLPILTG